MKLQPIKKRKRIYQEIIERIKLAIENGELVPGEKLPSERDLAGTLNVSRTSVKEAISVLESSGIVNIRPGVGVFISENHCEDLLNKFSSVFEDYDSDLIQLLELREAIESDAAFYAATRMTEQQKVKLDSLFIKLVEAEKNGEVAVEEDYKFHLAIIEAANNPLMKDVMNVISGKMIDVLTKNRKESMLNFKMNKEVVEEHRRVYEAIVQRKPDLARDAMKDHLKSIKERHS
ncbi:FadR family transcriptional regulator [Evansella sp. LMS18]|jgi:GntR family transcriptional repressor for pyruvate dehydrogenase complex|uniref:FadR/GntR family transcriptional regulator n=1 Tax=Evansella sp. LMS18 TaxID=2924033 RepID=UPI0020D17FCF|nr:FadR/GntR family transcriptional regulator [Evansella sp. LMS18]UTR11940.1 FadR family transcriptional regulator [Evansella sp. LMS18]